MDVRTVDNHIRRAFNSIYQAFRGKIARVKAAGGVQQIQVEGLEGETMQGSKHAESFGFTSSPSAGSDCIVVPLGGETSHGIVVTTINGAHRITSLVEGEATVYNADGTKMVLKRGRIIEIDCEALNIKAPSGMDINAPNVGCTAQITAEGQVNGNGGMAVRGNNGASSTGNVKMVNDLGTTGKLTNNGKNVDSDYKHTGDNGGTTSDPLQFRWPDIHQTKP